MATQKTSTTKRTTKKTELISNDTNEEVIEDIQQIKKTSESKAGKRLARKSIQTQTIEMDKSRRVPVLSVSSFPVGYNCKLTNMFIKWSNYGEEHSMTIEEILMMNAESEDFLHEPWLIVDDEEFAEAMNLKDLYELIFEIEDLDTFYGQRIITIENKLDKLPSGTRKNLITRTIKMINDGYFNNLGVIKLFKNKYGINIEI
jgi:hypothetical protein